MYQKAPDGLPLTNYSKYCSIDGDADRLVYFFIDKDPDGSLEPSYSLSDRTMVEGDPYTARGFALVNRSKRYSLFAMFKYVDKTYLSFQVPSGKVLQDKLSEIERRQNVVPKEAARGTDFLSMMSFCLGEPIRKV